MNLLHGAKVAHEAILPGCAYVVYIPAGCSWAGTTGCNKRCRPPPAPHHSQSGAWSPRPQSRPASASFHPLRYAWCAAAPAGPARLTPQQHARAARDRCPPQVVVPVGAVPGAVLPQYHSLIARHRQVELQLVRSFYKEQQKSPFKFLPWKSGALHFRFAPARPWPRARAAPPGAVPSSVTRRACGRRRRCSRPACWRSCTSTATCWA